MEQQFPMEYALENGVQVQVEKIGSGMYHFSLSGEDGVGSGFDYVEGERTKAEWDEVASFDQLEALRVFWLKTEEVL